MSVTLGQPSFKRLDADSLAAWAKVPASIVCDQFDEAVAIDPAIRPLPSGIAFAGQAVTVSANEGDLIAVHHALTRGWPGAVLVIDGAARRTPALIGEILTGYAKSQGFKAVLVDGPARDAGTLRAMPDIPVYSRFVTPEGPVTGTRGAIGIQVTCGGRRIRPGDLLVGDDDGVAVVPVGTDLDALMAGCQARRAKEDDAIERCAAGESPVEIFSIPPLG